MENGRDEPADPVYIGLGRVGEIEIYHIAHALKIDASGHTVVLIFGVSMSVFYEGDEKYN